MDKNQLISTILDLCDENEKLKYKLKQQEISRAANDVGELSLVDNMAGMTSICINIGKKNNVGNAY